MARIHIIGGGLAGLSAAVFAHKAGANNIVIYDQSPKIGGRFRSIESPIGSHDNGTHLLINAYENLWEFLALIGAQDQLEEVNKGIFNLYEGPLGWEIRDSSFIRDILFGKIPGVKLWNILGKIAQRRLWNPLAIAVFNCSINEVAPKLLLSTLKTISKAQKPPLKPFLFKGCAMDILGCQLPEPIEIKLSKRLKGLSQDCLSFSDENIALSKDDRVILALPPQAYDQIDHPFSMPSLTYNAIANVHFYLDHNRPTRFFGMINTLSQWVLIKDGLISVTISDFKGEKSNLASKVWREICFHLDMSEAKLPPHKVVIEKFATPFQDSAFEQSRPLPKTSINHIFMAGDFTKTGLPCTIEGAILSGKRAAYLAVL